MSAAEYVASVTYTPGADEIPASALANAERLAAGVAESDAIPALYDFAAQARIIVNGAEHRVDHLDDETDLDAVVEAATRRLGALHHEIARELTLLATVREIREFRQIELLIQRMKSGGHATVGDFMAAEGIEPGGAA